MMRHIVFRGRHRRAHAPAIHVASHADHACGSGPIVKVLR